MIGAIFIKLGRAPAIMSIKYEAIKISQLSLFTISTEIRELSIISSYGMGESKPSRIDSLKAIAQAFCPLS
jgi:hypothetical protein